MNFNGDCLSHGAFVIPRLLKRLPIKDFNNKTVLDGGAGLGEVGLYFRAASGRFDWGYSGQPHMVGADINEKSVDFLKVYLPHIYNEIYCMDLDTVDTVLKGRHFDMTMLHEVCEHVEKKKMLRILGKLENISDCVFITTPCGDEMTNFYKYDEEVEFNHVSIWEPEDFKERGYSVQVEHTIEFGRSPIAKAYIFARDHFGTPIQRKIIATWKR